MSIGTYASQWNRVMQGAARVSAETWLRVWAHPENNITVPTQLREPYYSRFWDYYSNQMYQDLRSKEWQEYRARWGLYRFSRPIKNPTFRGVNFYADEIWPGVVSADGEPLAEGVPSAFPLDKRLDVNLRRAVAQIFQWTNFPAMKSVIPIYAGALGSTFLEIVDDMERGKVYFQNWWPGHIAGLVLDRTGNVKAYALEYIVPELTAADVPTGNYYVYRKEVDRAFIRTFRDNEPYDFVNMTAGGPFAKIENPYGFTPAVLFKFYDLGDDFGLPMFWAALAKIDELNSLVAMIHDQIGKIVGAPVLVAGEAALERVDAARLKPQDELWAARNEAKSNRLKDRERFKVLEVPQGTSVQTIPMNIAEAETRIVDLDTELERDYPELGAYEQLREMQNATGPAIERLLGNVGKKLWSTSSRFDLQMVKALAMGIAMAGYRANGGQQGWGSKSVLTEQQKLFTPFTLDSYAAGKLTFTPLLRPLVPTTTVERWTARATQINALVAAKGLNIPDAQLQSEAGYNEQEIETFAEATAQSEQAVGEALLRGGGGLNPGSGAGADIIAQLQQIMGQGGTNAESG